MKDNRSLSPLDKLLWAIIGLLLTISGVFVNVAISLPQIQWPMNWSEVQTYSLGVAPQIGAVLFVGCMAGRNAAALAQIAYLILGLFLGFQIFARGGGLGYLQEPTFGYLLGFLPGAWICGYFAFKEERRLEALLRGSLWGLFSIHAVGILYLSILSLLRITTAPWWNAVVQYSIQPLPGQFIIVCTVAALAYLLRIVLFY